MISIIIPVFNNSGTVRRAIDSCIKQSYKDVEIIVVDDCSTDNTLEIVRSVKDNRIKVIENTENLGAGMSRRIGVENSKGDYLFFLDSDDTIEPDTLELLLTESIKNNADIVAIGINSVDEYGNIIDSKIPKESIETGLSKYNYDKEDTKRFLCNKLVKSSLFKDVQYCDFRLIEDTTTLLQLLWYANKIVNIPIAKYNYYQINSSLSHIHRNNKECLNYYLKKHYKLLMDFFSGKCDKLYLKYKKRYETI